MSDIESWLSDIQDGVATAQLVLTEVERGLVTAEKAEAIAKRVRPLLRTVLIVILGCGVGLGVALLIKRRRRSGEIENETSEEADGSFA